MPSHTLSIHCDKLPGPEDYHGSEFDHLINDLISAANSNDRFKLLEDSDILPPNLTNPIHPIFGQLESDRRLRLALQLASHFLLHDRLLEFFVPLLFGRELHHLQSSKNYLSNPLVKASKVKRVLLLSSVRDALKCMADRITISFLSQKQRVWARTIMDDATSRSCSCSCRAFQSRKTPRIELTEKFSQFYYAANGYAQASRSAQLRHDFLFAATLVHEVVHAVGVMRRGNLTEPHYRLEYPESEWGYAWENFMFGSIINPQEKTKPGTHILMRKIWADAKVANESGGKEYSDVSMSWIAQWFRAETWTAIARKGPTAVTPPSVNFKIQISHKHGAWVVWSDSPEVRNDIAALYIKWQTHSQRFEAKHCSSAEGKGPNLVYYNGLATADLQLSNVPIPHRHCGAPKSSLIRNLFVSDKKPSKNLFSSATQFTPIDNTTLVTVHREVLPCDAQRKRPTHEGDDLSTRARKRKR